MIEFSRNRSPREATTPSTLGSSREAREKRRHPALSKNLCKLLLLSLINHHREPYPICQSSRNTIVSLPTEGKNRYPSCLCRNMLSSTRRHRDNVFTSLLSHGLSLLTPTASRHSISHAAPVVTAPSSSPRCSDIRRCFSRTKKSLTSYLPSFDSSLPNVLYPSQIMTKAPARFVNRQRRNGTSDRRVAASSRDFER